MAVYLIIAAVLAVMAVLLFSPAALEFSFVWNEEIKRTSLKLRYLFIKKNLDKRKPVKENKKKKEKKKYTLDDVKGRAKQLLTIFDGTKSDLGKIFIYAKSRLTVIKRLDVNVDFDTENPMNTGILTGAINGGVYNLMSFIDCNMNLKNWSIRITPMFENKNYFDIRIESIIEIKIAHIIGILLKSVPMLLKVRKLLKVKNKDERK